MDIVTKFENFLASGEKLVSTHSGVELANELSKSGAGYAFIFIILANLNFSEREINDIMADYSPENQESLKTISADFAKLDAFWPDDY